MITFTLEILFQITYEKNFTCSCKPPIKNLYKQSKGFELSTERACITNKIEDTVYTAHISHFLCAFLNWGRFVSMKQRE